MRTALSISMVLLLAAACGGSMTELNTLARDDLRCDSNLTFTKVDEKTRIASGCGKEITYTEQCDAKDECHWVRDSDVRRDSL
jgi:hypothetical protein